MNKIIKNDQIVKINAKNLERPAKTTKYDSTIEERDRNHMTRKPEPRFSEYR